MVDTIRQVAALQALLPDNTSALISPQDVRDFLVSAMPSGRTAITVAASNASDRWKAQADYVCDGTADEVEIQAAIDSLPPNTGDENIGIGGKIVLSPGLFRIAAPITIDQNQDCVWLEGQGMRATIISVPVNVNGIVGAGDSASSSLLNVQIGNLRIMCDEGASTAVGLQIKACEQAYFHNLFITHGDVGMELTAFDRVFCHNIEVGYQNTVCFDFVNDDTANHNAAATITMINCEPVISVEGGIGIRLRDGGTNTAFFGRIEWHASMIFADTSLADSTLVKMDRGARSMAFYNCDFENGKRWVDSNDECYIAFHSCTFLRSGRTTFGFDMSDSSFFDYYSCNFQNVTTLWEQTAGNSLIQLFGKNKNDGGIGIVSVSAVSVANPSQLTTSSPHGYNTGDSVTLSDFSTTPDINGVRVITVVDATHFTIPVNVTAVSDGAGTAQRAGYQLYHPTGGSISKKGTDVDFPPAATLDMGGEGNAFSTMYTYDLKTKQIKIIPGSGDPGVYLEDSIARVGGWFETAQQAGHPTLLSGKASVYEVLIAGTPHGYMKLSNGNLIDLGVGV